MDDRLNTLLERADTCLDATSRATLAEIVDAFIATHQGAQDFTDAELEHLRHVDSEPFRPADPQEVAALRCLSKELSVDFMRRL